MASVFDKIMLSKLVIATKS